MKVYYWKNHVRGFKAILERLMRWMITLPFCWLEIPVRETRCGLAKWVEPVKGSILIKIHNRRGRFTSFWCFQNKLAGKNEKVPEESRSTYPTSFQATTMHKNQNGDFLRSMLAQYVARLRFFHARKFKFVKWSVIWLLSSELRPSRRARTQNTDWK